MDWLIDLGYVGLFIGPFVAGTVLPLSSDVLLVGLLAAGGDPIACLVVATLGNWLGAMTSYVLGWYAKWEWLEKYFKSVPKPSSANANALIAMAFGLRRSIGHRLWA